MDPKFILTNDDTNDTNDTTDSSIATTSTNNSKKKRGVNRKYYFSSDHESFIEAKKLIDSEKTWTAITPKNNTHYYRCNKVVSRSSKWCSAAVYIYKHQDNQIPDEDSPHEPFVLDFQIFDEDDIDTLVDFEEGDQFRVVITTRHLLKFILRKWSYSRDTDQNINAKPFIDEPSISLVRQPFRSLIDADDADLDENDEVDDDIPFDEDLNLELNQLTHSQRENIDRDYYDRLYCNELDVSLMNNGNMFGLQDIQPTTSSILSSDNSTLPYNMDHISNICDDYVHLHQYYLQFNHLSQYLR
jgi:hypothetical protein